MTTTGNFLNPWTQLKAYVALAATSFGMSLSFVPFGALIGLPLAMAGLVATARLQDRTGNVQQLGGNWSFRVASVAGLVILFIGAFLGLVAQVELVLARSRNQSAPPNHHLGTIAILALLASAILTGSAARAQRATFRECLPIAFYWVGFVAGPAVGVSLMEMLGCHFSN